MRTGVRHGPATVVFVFALTVVAACSSSGAGPPDSVTGKIHSVLAGRPVSPPIIQPGMTLVDTAGKPFNVRNATAGKLTFVFFGYTNCPDVCPTTMADIAAAVGRVNRALQHRVEVIFVTSDPTRDTGPVMRHWLNQFDTSFVGLTGTWSQITAYASALRLPMVQPSPTPAGTPYSVMHAARVAAFGPDGSASVVYLADATPLDYAHDIPLLLDR
jgi:protein SCO1/2